MLWLIRNIGSSLPLTPSTSRAPSSSAQPVQALATPQGESKPPKYRESPMLYNLWVDSSSAKSIIQRDGVGKIKHLDVRALWLQAEREKHQLILKKVAGERNPSDLGTKVHGKARFEALVGMAGFVDCGEIDDNELVGVARVTSSSATSSSRLLQALVGLSLVQGSKAEGGMVIHVSEASMMIMIMLFTLVVGVLLLLVGWRSSTETETKTTTRKEKLTRSVATQSQTTYSRKLSRPRFVPLREWEEGAWVDCFDDSAG